MTREELIAIVADRAGPLGPLRTPEDHERLFRDGMSRATSDDLQRLADLSTEGPPAWSGLRLEEWHDSLVEALVELGTREPRLARLLEARLAPGPGRIVSISALGAIGLPSSIAALGALVADATLSTDERIMLADALGEIGGPEAIARLCEMRGLSGDAVTLREIDIVLEHIALARST